MTTNTTTASQPNAAPSGERNAVLGSEAARAIRRAVKYLKENGCTGPAADLEALLAAPALPEPAAAQEPVAQPLAASAVPEGWRLVPIVPNDAMTLAGATVDDERESVWGAYLAAAPDAPRQEAQTAVQVPTNLEEALCNVLEQFTQLSTDAIDERVPKMVALVAPQPLAEVSAAQAPEGYALVPLHVTREMQRVMEEEGWQWEDLLGAAEAITDEQYNEIQAGPAAQAVPFDREEFIRQVVLSVAEIPDRDSPENQPEMMLVTSKELKNIMENYFEMADEKIELAQPTDTTREA